MNADPSDLKAKAGDIPPMNSMKVLSARGDRAMVSRRTAPIAVKPK